MHVPAPVVGPADGPERCVALVRRRVRVPEASAHVPYSPVSRRRPRARTHARARIRPSRLRIVSLALFNDAGRIYAPLRIFRACSPPHPRGKYIGRFRSFQVQVEVGEGKTARPSRHRRRPRSSFANTPRCPPAILPHRFRGRADGLKFHILAQVSLWSRRPPTGGPLEHWNRLPAHTLRLRPSKTHPCIRPHRRL